MGIGARDARISVTLKNALQEPEPEDTASTNDRSDALETDPAPNNIVEEPVAETEEPTLENEGSTGSEVREPAPEDLISDVRDYASQAADLIGLNARVEAYDAGDFIAVDVATEQAGLFIGQKGETIDALQYLLNVSVYRDREFSKRVVLDSEGYRQRRIEAIQGIAHRTARRAIREQRPFELPPMSASERRTVHQYLQDDDRVTTSSEGRGDSRKVRISPL